jgi:hypothetical protein
MASIIKIKRSGTTGGGPTTLGNGELAYSYLAGTQANGGDRVYIGVGTETAGNAAERHVIGGKYFTDMLDHVKGTLTADSAIITNASSEIDELRAGNFFLNDNVLRVQNASVAGIGLTAETNIDLNITTLRDGLIRYVPTTGGETPSVAYEARLISVNDPNSIPNKKYVDDLLGAQNSLVVEDEDLLDPETVNFGTDTLQITGGEGIDTTVTKSGNRVTVTVSGELATAAANVGASNLGIASYNSTNFTVTSGFVESNDITIGTTALTLGETTTTLAGLTQLDVDNVRIDGNTVSSTNANGNLTLDANGTGNIDVNNNRIINLADPVDVLDAVNFQTLLSSIGDVATLVVQDDALTDIEVFLTEDKLVFVGGEGMNVTAAVTAGPRPGLDPETVTFTITGEDASDTNKGIASFDATNFTVTAGNVVANDITLGTSTLTLGDTTLTLAGLEQVTVDELDINGSTISAVGVAADLNVNLQPKGAGVVSVANDTAGESRITNVADPVGDSDAANKRYVDEVAQGLTVRPTARAGTTGPLSGTYSNGTLGVGATLTAGLNEYLGLIDGVGDTTPSAPIYGATQTDRPWAAGDLILVKNQANAFENGLYEVTQPGNGSTPWILTRQRFVDEADEIPSSYVFIQEGDTLAGTGWTAIVEDFNAFDVGVDDIVWYQFSGGGSLNEGDGINVAGTTISVDISATGSGLDFAPGTSGNALVINPLIAGDGLVWDGTTTGILNVADLTVPLGGTGLTSVTARAILFGNGSSALGVTAASTIDGSFLREDATGSPYWSNVIDGGEY